MKISLVGILASVLLSGAGNLHAAVLYVNAGNTGPVSPYSTWTTAATNIQNAVDAANPGDLVLVTNGVYKNGGRIVYGSLSNRVVIVQPITVQSVNGPAVTFIQGTQVATTNGNGAVRCAYVANGAALNGFTLTNGATLTSGDSIQGESGGGVWCAGTNALVSNCVFTHDAADNYGGGAWSGTLSNCFFGTNTCLNIGGGACSNILLNCTLAGNSASVGGGAGYVQLMANSWVSNNTAVGNGGGVAVGTFSNCTFMSNIASEGGAAVVSTLVACKLSGNTATNQGGGARACTLTNCVLTGNFAWGAGGGGGASEGAMFNCTVTNNIAADGGGLGGVTAINCLIAGNFATNRGGGMFSGAATNCLVENNTAAWGGGAFGANLGNCTVTANTAFIGPGAYGGSFNNSIVYYNSSPGCPNFIGSAFTYSCATPLPVGPGNIAASPRFGDAFRLSASSPCIGAGNPSTAVGTDLNGEPWANPPSMGCSEFYPALATGALSVQILANYTSVAAGFPLNFNAFITGAANTNFWSFGDGTVAVNSTSVSHVWTSAGTYTVTFWSGNQNNPAGVAATQLIQVVKRPVAFVCTNNPAALSPFNTWATAATNIQDALNAMTIPGALIVVSNGVYASRGTVVYGAMTNRIAVMMPVILQSLDGPAVTAIQGCKTPGTMAGNSAVRCVYLADGATLSGFTLTNGCTRSAGDIYREQGGGAIWCASGAAIVTNCVLAGNAAALYGGGAFGGTLTNCTLTANSLAAQGGGIFGGVLYNCLLTSNFATNGGGACGGMLAGCTLSNNISEFSGGGASTAVLNGCVLAGNVATNGGGVQGGWLFNCTLTNNLAGAGGGETTAALTDCLLVDNAADEGGGGNFGECTNCTFIGNSAASQGGGDYSSTLVNCTLTGNYARYGGGAYGAVLINCVLAGNSATNTGGGAYNGGLFNCTLTGNSAPDGGGIHASSATNSIIYNNSAPSGSNYDSGTLDHCCTTPLPAGGTDNITNNPGFVNLAGGDFHLQANSPCINSGNNNYVAGVTDLDGNPRIQGGTVDLGAYEYQTPASIISYAWLQQYGLPIDGSADHLDSDGTGMNNWQKWIAGLNPTNSASVLRMLSVSNSVAGAAVSWQSVGNVTYYLQRCSDLTQPAFSSIQSNIIGQPIVTSFTDSGAVGAGPFYYRVGVQQ